MASTPKKKTAKKKATPKKKKTTPKTKAKKARRSTSLKFVQPESFSDWGMTGLPDEAFEIVYQPSSANSLPSPISVLEGHAQFVQALAFSPDGQLLATGSEDGTVRIWDVANAQSTNNATCIKTASDHSSAVNGLSFTPDGRYLLTASDDHSIKVWSVPAFEVVRTLEGHTDYVSKVYPVPGQSSGSRALSSGKDGSLRLWDLATGECIREMQHGGWVAALGISNDGKRAVASSDRNVMRVWDLTTGAIERVLLDASGDYIGDVMGFSLAADNLTGVGHETAPRHIVFSPDDKTFLSSYKDIIVWDTTTGAEHARMDGDGWPMGGISFIPDRASASRGDVDPAERAFLEQLRNDPDNHAVRSVYGDWLEERGRLPEANGVRRHGAARHVFVAGHDKVHIFDLVARAIVAQAPWPHGDTHRVAVSPDGRWGASGSNNGPVALWDLDALLRAGMPSVHVSRPSSIAVSQEGIALTASSDRTVRLWSMDGKTSERLPVTEGLFLNVSFTPDGRRVLVMTDTGSVSVFDSRTAAFIGTARVNPETRHYVFNKYVFLRDGRLLNGSSGGPLVIWNVDDPSAPPEEFKEEAGHVIGMAVDEDADLIVTSEYARDEPMPIKLWSLSKRTMTRAIALKVEVDQYVCGVAIVDNRIVCGTSAGGLLILDREDGSVIEALQLSKQYFDSLMTLPDPDSGKVVLGGATPWMVDVRGGSGSSGNGSSVSVSQFDWGDGKYAVVIDGTTRALASTTSSEGGIALLDFAEAARSLSAFTPTPPTHDFAASRGGGEFVVTTLSPMELAGRPMVLRVHTVTE